MNLKYVLIQHPPSPVYNIIPFNEISELIVEVEEDEDKYKAVYITLVLKSLEKRKGFFCGGDISDFWDMLDKSDHFVIDQI